MKGDGGGIFIEYIFFHTFAPRIRITAELTQIMLLNKLALLRILFTTVFHNRY